jgi:hypothetical protein
VRGRCDPEDPQKTLDSRRFQLRFESSAAVSGASPARDRLRRNLRPCARP